MFNYNLLKVIILLLLESISILEVRCKVNPPNSQAIQTEEIKWAEITLHIKNGNFTLADEELSKFDSNLRSRIIQLIVRSMYAENRNNFRTLNSYAGKTQYHDVGYHVLEQLWRGMRVNSVPTNFTETCELYKSITVNIINPQKLDDEYIEYANLMLSSLRGIIEKFAIPSLASSLERNIYQEAQEIANSLYSVSENLFDEIITKVINSSYNGMRFRELVHAMWTHKFTGQKAAALSSIFLNLKRNLIHNPESTMIIAYYFYKLQNLPDYSNLPGYNLVKIKNHIYDLPSSVRNVYFSEYVCIRNVESKDYIAPDILVDDYNHGVFLKSGGNRRIVAAWYVIPVDELKFKFRNMEYSNQYLYTGDTTSGFWTYERLVYTWRAKANLTGEMNRRLIWSVLLHGNQITMRNEVFDEYLCQSEETTNYGQNSKYRSAVTMEKYSSNCAWTLE